MPPYNKHLETSTKRTGKDYQAIHDWLDNHPQMKAERHSLDKLTGNISFVRSSFGNEAVAEYLQQLVEDALMQDIETLKKNRMS
ncbi:MAG: hypothetical protein ACUBOA_09870 [Candidatus Loosdrechtia sp.]|uniref:hypothetical protein n=1 Tax=Candidatus Loosdrechtia sp. TaxID=3101272 RepID=UPI003A5DA98D|nr:MAG: hypothetical protein QY305_03310 [Candidatus Jettenia sp. AMX2]